MTNQTAMSVRKSILVTGAHASGKTHFLTKLFKAEREVWGAKIKNPAVFISATAPLSSWTENANLVKWFEEKNAEAGLLWKKQTPIEKQTAFIEFVAASKCVLFVDDADKLAGRKLKLATDLVTVSKIYVLSTSNEQKLHPSLRVAVLRREPQTFRLKTEASYDVTAWMMYALMFLCLIVGFWEATAVLGALRFLATGARATRNA